MRIHPNSFLSVLWLCFWMLTGTAFTAQAQDKEKEKKDKKKGWSLHHTLEGGYSIGAQQANESIESLSGLIGNYTAQLQVSNRISYGLGFGYEAFESETFIPIYLDFKGKLRKKNNSPYLSTQFGYALGSNDTYLTYADYTYRGGLFFSPGIGYLFSVKGHFSCLLSASYKHQFAHVRYDTFDGEEFREELNFDMLLLRIGILLPQ